MPSTVIRSINYDAVTQTLQVIFVSGLIYAYKKVPLDVFEAMKAAPSKGTYLNTMIKGKYEFENLSN